jgi:HEAT repeat protein
LNLKIRGLVNRLGNASDASQAADELVKIGAPAIELLIRTLDSASEVARAFAAHTLGRIGSPDAVPALIRALKDPLERVRSSAAEALGLLGDPRAVTPLCDLLKQHPDPAAARALARLGGMNAIEALIRALKDRDEVVRSSAADALGLLGDRRAVTPLCDLLKQHRDPAAARALGKMGDPGAVTPLLQAGSLAVSMQNRFLQRAVGEALLELGAVEPLVEAVSVSRKDAAASRTWLEVLSQSSDWRFIPALTSLLASSDEYLRRDVIAALGRFNEPEVIQALLPMLSDNQRNVRQKAADQLIQLGWQPGQDENAACYWATREEWQRCAEIGAPAIPILTHALTHWVTADELQLWNEWLWRAKIDAPHTSVFTTMLRYRNSFSFFAIAAALAKTSAAALKPLEEMMRCSNSARRMMATWSLELLDWTPQGKEDEASFCIARQEWGRCLKMGAPAVALLLQDLENPVLETTLRKDIAKTLVKLYQRRDLEEALRQRILHARPLITEHHSETSCNYHMDSGLNVDFPL